LLRGALTSSRYEAVHEEAKRNQSTRLPVPIAEDWIAEDNPVRAVDPFVDGLDLFDLGFTGVELAATAGLVVRRRS
jgi:hypothetical protein